MQSTRNFLAMSPDGQPFEPLPSSTKPVGIQKRNRTQLSCKLCRTGKLKCNRGQPCDQCVKRDRLSSCSYSRPPQLRKPAQNLRTRLHHLENFVVGMIKENNRTVDWPVAMAPTDSIEVDKNVGGYQTTDTDGQEPSELQSLKSVKVTPSTKSATGQVIVCNAETTYIGSTHWAAVLDDIDSLKSYFNDLEEEHPADGEDIPCPDVIFGSPKGMVKEGLLAALPERNIVDRLVYQYFSSNDPSMHILHKPTFQNEYKMFWENQSHTSICWLGLLYAIMCLGTYMTLRAGEQRPDAVAAALENIDTYRTLCAQCHILSDYTKPGRHTVTAFIFYTATEFIRSSSTKYSIWLLSGVAVRIALRLGYHRDPGNQRNISVFQGEMRRRVWHALVQLDLLLSFQLGLPSMIRTIQSDTAYPHNLLDSDFAENSLQLPPPRPESEPTTMSYMISKSRLCAVFGAVAEQANSTSPTSYTEVLDLDARLKETYAAVPQILHVKSLDQSLIDPPELIMERFNIALLYQKSRCVLHRNYLVEANKDSDHNYSRTTCLHAAMELLAYQSQIDQAIQSGGQLSRDKWYASSLTMHDFLLGAMIISLHLRQGFNSIGENQGEGEEHQRLTTALKTSWSIWKADPNSKESKKAERVLNCLVQIAEQRSYLERIDVPAGTRSPSWSVENITDACEKCSTLAAQQLLTQQPSEDQPMCENTPRSMSDIGAMSLAAINDSQKTPVASIQAMMGASESLDWRIWDNQIDMDDMSTLNQTWLGEMAFDDLEF